jgi:hypothetical protein
MRNQYQHLDVNKFVICLSLPFLYEKEFTVGNKYKILNYNYNYLTIESDIGQQTFNIHSPFGDSFCTIQYLRKKKLNQLQ